MKKFIIFLVLCGFTFPAVSANVRFEVGEPILTHLTIGSERVIQFPEPVAFGARGYYDSLFRYDIIESSLYITPFERFRERLVFRGIASSQMYVLDAVSSEDSTSARLVIHVPSEDERPRQVESPRRAVTPVDLFQFASQNLFAPDTSLIEPLEGARRVNISQDKLENFYREGAFTARPYASWFAGGRYVTAVQLTNITPAVIHFDPCMVRGRFEIASQQTSTATPYGSNRDSLMAYFITSEPFHVAASRNEGFPCR